MLQLKFNLKYIGIKYFCNFIPSLCRIVRNVAVRVCSEAKSKKNGEDIYFIISSGIGSGNGNGTNDKASQ